MKLEGRRSELLHALGEAIDVSENVAVYSDILFTHPTLVNGLVKDLTEATAAAVKAMFSDAEVEADADAEAD